MLGTGRRLLVLLRAGRHNPCQREGCDLNGGPDERTSILVTPVHILNGLEL